MQIEFNSLQCSSVQTQLVSISMTSMSISIISYVSNNDYLNKSEREINFALIGTTFLISLILNDGRVKQNNWKRQAQFG